MALLELDARFQSALTRLQTATPPLPFTGFEQSLNAISLRLSEGKERPSEALPIRRQLLEAQAASYRRLQAAHLLCRRTPGPHQRGEPMNQVLRLSLLILALVAIVACDRKSQPRPLKPRQSPQG